MSIWLFRAGSKGEHENKFLTDNRVYLTWDDLDFNILSIKEKSALYDKMQEHYKLDKRQTAINYGAQAWPIAHLMKKGDWIALPSKLSRTIHFGEIIGDYVFDKSLGSPYYHYRNVRWFATDVPRDTFDQDILYSLGAFMTVCKIEKNNAEQRIKELYKSGWKTKAVSAATIVEEVGVDSKIDLDEYISDQIAERIIQHFKGHRMEELIDGILKAKGFTTFHSPPGADNGVDILASEGPLGFGAPKICVQVKSYDTQVDRPTLDQLIGAMSIFGADYGLLVSWSGFKSSVLKEISKQFFKVRLWDSKQIIHEIFENYDKLNDDIKTELPLKRIWMLNLD